ncbi:cyanophycinase [Roseivirga sp. E12]|uniref:cyanophycinase n=1 Tax=Roseivirga sp. E12 TaxID=2819237 RepID=UPI001ABC39FC|nr:cyanophycinase [Roseivirga sp. E12]MBO3700639.1 cyanophycinase [Roseivirga sp. E12]
MRLFLSVIALFICFGLSAQTQTTGPEKGHLIIAGGALRDADVYAKFMELAGGEQSHIVVIPTAGGYEVTEQRIAGLVKSWKARGAAEVTVLHTTDPKEADTEAFAGVLKEATGVYLPGGRQWRFADSYLDTKVQEYLFDLLDRGGVIAGSSAGATIQGSYLARGDSRTNTIMVGDHEEGFGFVKNIAIDQHTMARNRQFDMFEVLKVYPDLLGISIDENTAILVTGNQFEVIGQSYVLVYDGTHWDQTKNQFVKNQPGQERFHMLRKGRKYDMGERKIITQQR